MAAMNDAATLADLNEAYVALLKGEGIRELRDQNGETITYTRANLDKLAAKIQELQITVGTGTRGPLRPVF